MSNAPDPEHAADPAADPEESRHPASTFLSAPTAAPLPPAHFAPSAARYIHTVTAVPSAVPRERMLPGRWPLGTFLELGALEGAVPSARLHARYVVQERGLASLTDSIELVVSELVTNAVQAARAIGGAAIRLWVLSDRSRIAVLVWDPSPRPPERKDAQGDAENGRGLLLVETLSQQWGWYWSSSAQAAAGDAEGKFVWAVICPTGQPA